MDLTASFAPVVSAFMQSDARHRFILGPFGSGKSVGSQWEIPRRGAAQRPSSVDGRRKTRFAVIRNTMPQLRDTTMKTWFDWFPNGSLGYYKETGKTYHIKQGDIDCEVMFRALDDPSDVKNLLSLELTGAYLNEFRDIHRDIVEALDGRVGRYPKMSEGGPSWVGIWGDSNMPEEEAYWEHRCEGRDPDEPKTKRVGVVRRQAFPNGGSGVLFDAGIEVFKQPPGMLRQGDGSYVSNPNAENRANLPPGYYENLIRGKGDDFIRVYVMCEYGRSKGGKPVHPLFSRDLHVAKQLLVPNRDLLLIIAADFGRTPALALKQQDAFGRVLTLDEIVMFDTSVEPVIEEKLLPLLRRKYDGFETFVTGDPSGSSGGQAEEASCADVFRRYKNKGIGKVKLAYTNSPLVRQGATDHFLSRLVGRGMPAYLVSPNCEWTVAALSGKYRFKQFKDGRPSDDVEKNEHSHIGEANEYGDMYFERGGRRKAEIRDRQHLPVREPQNPYAMPR